MTDFSHYLSPFSWRYGSPEMRRMWSEENKRRLWRVIWAALAEAEQEFGLVSAAQVEELHAHIDQVDIKRALELESEIHHDLIAELKVFAEQCPKAGGILHLGATSTDVEDNADAIRIRRSLDLILEELKDLGEILAGQIEQTANLTIMAFTHLQPAEPTTLGYRLAFSGQDLLDDWRQLKYLRSSLKGKGFKGAVGTAAAYQDLIGKENFLHFEKKLNHALDLDFFEVSSQTYPRKQDYQVLSALAGLGGTLYKLAFDLRLLQSPGIGELSEPFGQKQVGSSAMPFKRNPINAEKIDSLARSLAVMPQIAWGNAAHSLLERTLDDSANRRSLLPEAFLITDELLITARWVLKDLNIDKMAIKRNMECYAPFAATERILMAASRKGADRQEIHARLRQHSLAAWSTIQSGLKNPLGDLIKADEGIKQYLTETEIDELTSLDGYTGIASERAQMIAKELRSLAHEETAVL